MQIIHTNSAVLPDGLLSSGKVSVSWCLESLYRIFTSRVVFD